MSEAPGPEERDRDPEDRAGTIARRALLGNLGLVAAGLGTVAVLGATGQLVAAPARAAAASATPTLMPGHTTMPTPAVRPTAKPTAAAIDHDPEHEAVIKAFPAKTQGESLGDLPSRVVDGAREFEIVTKRTRFEVTPGHFFDAFSYNDRVPGPVIRVTEGERVRVKVRNELAESTGVHWHGQRVRNAADGVPFITQLPIKPGQTYTYEFIAGPIGTHMYHSHHNATQQVGQGMLGPLVVVPKDPRVDPAYDREEFFVFNDGLGGLTINGKGFPATRPFTAKLGERIRFRFMNEGQQIHPAHLHGLTLEVFARDGYPLAQPFKCDTLNIAPGERWDAIVIADEPGVWAFHCHVLGHAEGQTGMFGMVTALIVSA
ncbi:MAG TPA: multicopper oxidase domain-containing protein [Candidatus Limnocylindria bacterium]|nr:multicopper oxidase domain-containing protein [Candidatus Limnocylindria bacterium]